MTPTFLAMPTHYHLAEFRLYFAGLKFTTWRPRFPTLHNTGVPSLAQWLAMGPTPQERWGANLNAYYRGLGWHAGPHLVICPDYVWALCDLTQSGVSVSCWNSETFGIEMVGNYEVDGDDFESGDGARVRDNAAAVIAALADGFGWADLANFEAGVQGLHFHRECARDHHACPGGRVSKTDMLSRISACRAQRSAAQATPVPLSAPRQSAAVPSPTSLTDIQAALNRLGAQPALLIDGQTGPMTQAAIRAFQAAHGCSVDGIAGEQTRAALAAALTERGQARG